MWLVSECALWALVLLLAVLFLGGLQAINRLRWRLEQLEAVTPSRIGRSGLSVGSQAPDFCCPTLQGNALSLSGLTGKVLLIFLKGGCLPCERIVPALNRLQRRPNLNIVAVQSGEPDKVQGWANRLGVSFPVVFQQDLDLCRRYQVFAAPFAFLIDEQRTIVAKGLINSEQHLRYVLEGD
jgi:methylamine dehydrogenase accessory protein MauD